MPHDCLFPRSRRAQYALISRVFAGESKGLTRDNILDNITITWLTNTALSGARLYGSIVAKGTMVPRIRAEILRLS